MAKLRLASDIEALLDDGEDLDGIGWNREDLVDELSTHDESPLFGLMDDEDVSFDDDEDDDEDEVFIPELEDLVVEADQLGIPLDYGMSSFGALPRGRRRMARAVRARYTPPVGHSTDYQSGYIAGFEACLSASSQVSFGGLFKAVARGGRGLARLLGSTAEGLTGGVKLTDLARDVGGGMREGLEIDKSTPKDLGGAIAEAIRGGDAQGPSASTSVEAESSELPPIYVADPEGLQEEIEADPDATFMADTSDGLELAESFGATARDGILSRLPRRRAAGAMNRAMSRSAARLSQVSSERAEPFLLDPWAEPVLFDSGIIWEPVYGRMQPVPCPSCARVSPSYSGVNGGCTTCGDHGAILIPDGDVGRFAGCRYGSLIGTALVLGAPLAAKGMGNLLSGDSPTKEWLEDQGLDFSKLGGKAAQAKEAQESMGAYQAIVPAGFWADEVQRLAAIGRSGEIG